MREGGRRERERERERERDCIPNTVVDLGHSEGTIHYSV